jgi:ligand-binding sensor domain-containing protein
MKIITILTYLLSILLFTYQDSYSRSIPPHFIRIDQTKGLKNDVVVDFIQDDKGFIWIATYNGLYRYDGVRCRYFNLQSEKLQFHFVIETSCLFKMNDGSFLIGTRGNGILRFDATTEKTDIFVATSSHPSFPSTTIICIFVLDDKIIFGTDNGLFSSSLDGTHVEYYRDFPSTKVLKLYKASDGSVWIGTYSCGLIKFDVAKNKFSMYESAITKLRNNYSITTILEKDNNILWLGTWDNGLISFDRKTKRFTKIKNGNTRFNTCVVKDIANDGDGNLWIATFSEGLCQYSIADNLCTFYTAHSDRSNGLSNNTILRIFIDKSDDIWIGTWGGHACYFDLHAPSIHSLMHEINNTNSIVGNDVSTLLQEKNGTLWITTYNNGVTELSPDQKIFRSYTYPFLSNNSR